MKTINPFLACPSDCSKIYNPFHMILVNSQLVDYDTALPVSSVNVYLKSNPEKGTITDANGHFSLRAAEDDVIIFSHVSYGQYPVKAKEVMPIEYLQSSTNALDPVFITNKKKKNWLWAAAAAFGFFVLVATGEEDAKKPTNKKKPVKAIV